MQYCIGCALSSLSRPAVACARQLPGICLNVFLLTCNVSNVTFGATCKVEVSATCSVSKVLKVQGLGFRV